MSEPTKGPAKSPSAPWPSEPDERSTSKIVHGDKLRGAVSSRPEAKEKDTRAASKGTGQEAARQPTDPVKK